MATEVLVNDGGAPCRIIPLVAAEAITAGDAVGLTDPAAGADCKANQLTASEEHAVMAGVALTDAAAGAICNVVTGRGVIVRINTTDTSGPSGLMASATAGRLEAWSVADTYVGSRPVAVPMEDPSAVGLTKCMIL
jgi:hypothetical protein